MLTLVNLLHYLLYNVRFIACRDFYALNIELVMKMGTCDLSLQYPRVFLCCRRHEKRFAAVLLFVSGQESAISPHVTGTMLVWYPLNINNCFVNSRI